MVLQQQAEGRKFPLAPGQRVRREMTKACERRAEGGGDRKLIIRRPGKARPAPRGRPEVEGGLEGTKSGMQDTQGRQRQEKQRG